MTDVHNQIYAYIKTRLYRLNENAQAKRNTGELANLRRGIGRKPGDMPELWGVFFSDMPEDLMSVNGEPTYAEWAVYTVLTLYANHQQGNSENVNKEGIGLGKAISNLVKTEDDRARISRRFNAFATSADMIEASHHLRGLIQLLKAENQSLDYAELAGDLYEYQISEERRSRVRLKWGQDFYRYNNIKNNNDIEEE